MKRRMLMTMLAAATAVAFAAAPASAVTWGGEVFGAFNTFSMSDWNDGIDEQNATGEDFAEVNGGIGGGLGLRMWPNSNLMLAATWEPMFESSKNDATSGGELKLNGNSFQVTGGYFFPTTGPAKFGLGAGLGYYLLNGEAPELTTPATIELKGSTVGFHFMGMLEYTVSPGFAVTGNAGYRIAKISDTEWDGQSFPDFTGDPTESEWETDYSGLMLRAGLAFYMPSASGN